MTNNPPQPNVNDVLAAYLQLRAHKEALVAKHKDELAPVNDQMHKCLAWVQQQMQTQGLTNFKGSAGIAFLQTDTTVSVKDWDAMFEWIKQNEQWAFLEKRVSKSVVKDFMESQNGEIPPGLGVTTSVEAHIRKS
jgi:hypothetical protein